MSPIELYPRPKFKITWTDGESIFLARFADYHFQFIFELKNGRIDFHQETFKRHYGFELNPEAIQRMITMVRPVIQLEKHRNQLMNAFSLN